jgi:hypothetical protein
LVFALLALQKKTPTPFSVSCEKTTRVPSLFGYKSSLNRAIDPISRAIARQWGGVWLQTMTKSRQPTTNEKTIKTKPKPVRLETARFK